MGALYYSETIHRSINDDDDDDTGTLKILPWRCLLTPPVMPPVHRSMKKKNCSNDHRNERNVKKVTTIFKQYHQKHDRSTPPALIYLCILLYGCTHIDAIFIGRTIYVYTLTTARVRFMLCLIGQKPLYEL